jgi:Flp pilus assembly pilin Flp
LVGDDGRVHRSRDQPRESGASAVEYALLVAAIALGSILVIAAFLRVATSAYDGACDRVGRGGIADAPAACG